MTILAVDSSSKAASCALYKDNLLAGEFFINNGNTHSQTLLPLIENLLQFNSLSTKDIDYIAVTNGPGSFPGLRIGLATVKGLAFSSNITVIAVSTLKALAYNLICAEGLVVPIMDARRNQVYTAIYKAAGLELKTILPPTTLLIDELFDILKKYEENIYLVGDGAEIFYNNCKGNMLNLKIADETNIHQRASSILRLALAEDLTKSAIEEQYLDVEYLRLPQAQRELEEKQYERK